MCAASATRLCTTLGRLTCRTSLQCLYNLQLAYIAYTSVITLTSSSIILAWIAMLAFACDVHATGTTVYGLGDGFTALRLLGSECLTAACVCVNQPL